METMFFKNMGRVTAILDDNLFMQLHKRKTVRTVTVGKNVLMVEDTLNYDLPITEDEFVKEFDEHMQEMQKYVQLIKLKA